MLAQPEDKPAATSSGISFLCRRSPRFFIYCVCCFGPGIEPRPMAIYQTRAGTRDKSSSRKSGARPLRAARKAGDHPHKRLMTDPFIGDRNTATHLLQAVTTTPTKNHEPTQPHDERDPIFVLDHHETAAAA